MSNRIFNCNTCNDNSPITFVANDETVPLYYGIPSQNIISLNSDGSFNDGFIYGGGFNGAVKTIEIQTDGKILVGGDFTIYDGIGSNSIIRLNSDGSFDTTFNIGTGFNDVVHAIKIQSDGKILVGGSFTTYNGTSASRIIRLNPDGIVDTTFDYGSGFDGAVFTIGLFSDSELFVGGGFLNYNGNSSAKIIRLFSDGSVDNSFFVGSGFDSTVFDIVYYGSTEMLVGGAFTTYDGNPYNFIIRLGYGGGVLPYNSGNPGPNGVVFSIGISVSYVYLGGDFTEYNGNISNRIVSLNFAGEFISGLGDGFNSTVLNLNTQEYGKIFVSGDFQTFNGIPAKGIIKLNDDSTVDTTFDVDTGFDGVVNLVQIKSDQTLLVGGGSFANYQPTVINGLIKLNNSGTYNNSLKYKIGFNKAVRTISPQNDGKLIVGGEFQFFDGVQVNSVTRLNSDGTIDDTFNTGTGFNGDVFTSVIQSDNKILIGGGFTEYDGNPSYGIVRIDTDGTYDSTFTIGSGFNNIVRIITTQSDGKILVGGDFDVYIGNGSKYIVRINTDGTYDPTFAIGGGFNDNVYTIALQSNGKILIGGGFTDYNGTPTNRIIRLNSNGSIDGTFLYGNGFDAEVNTIVIQSDGKILVGGAFTDYDGIPINNIIRLNSNGSIDNTFITGVGFGGKVYTMTIQSDGKILVGGGFTSYDNVGSNFIIRLNSDGSVDPSFVYGDGFNDEVFSIELLSGNDIIVGGVFTSYPLKSGVFQLVEGNCVSIDSYDIVSRNPVEKFFSFGPFDSCTECTTPDDSPGTESIICLTCDDPESVTSTTVPHGVYLDERGRAIAQINTVGMGGFNGLNN